MQNQPLDDPKFWEQKPENPKELTAVAAVFYALLLASTPLIANIFVNDNGQIDTAVWPVIFAVGVLYGKISLWFARKVLKN